MKPRRVATLLVLTSTLLSGCFGAFTDSGTRLAYDIESAVKRNTGKDQFVIVHRPAQADECSGAYKVQLDKVGALIVWCYGPTGSVVASGSTTYHARFIDTPQTWIVDKPAGSSLMIGVEQRGSRAVIVDVR